jgi:uncharacterized protein (DUF305 family)
MNAITRSIATSLFIVTAVTAASAQEGHDTGGAALPEICKSGATDASAMEMPAMPEGMDAAHQAMMEPMGPMNADMAQGMMAEDIDVAFACGMIPHHQGALDMAKAELQYGDDQWAKDKAQQIIDAQEKEIAELKAWLEEQSK